MHDKYLFYKKALKKREEQNRYRQLRCVIPLDESHIQCEGKTYLNFSSNDYLGLSRNPHVKKNTIKHVLKWGVGSTASRLVTGHLECHQETENKIADLTGYESSLLFSTGYQANSSVITTIANNKSIIFIDRFCHNSLIQGSKASGARVVRYEHNDIASLARLLDKYKDGNYSTRIIISESIFSMDGDLADIDSLIELSDVHDTLLFIDDSHAVGVMGKNGMGLTSYKKGIDLTLGTFGKAMGSFGAFIGCNKVMREYLINFCSGFIYSTALPPAILGAVLGALDLIPDMESERKQILENSQWLRIELNELGFNTGKSKSHIIPIIIGSEEETLDLADALKDKGILAIPIRPPTVPQGLARLRISINSLHTSTSLNQILETIKAWKEESESFKPALSFS